MANTVEITKGNWAVWILGINEGIVRLIGGFYVGYKGAKYGTLDAAALSFS
jgi:hypothetical protein